MKYRWGQFSSVRVFLYNKKKRIDHVVWFQMSPTNAGKLFKRLRKAGPQPAPKRPKHKKKVMK